jgi:hypothetical protein
MAGKQDVYYITPSRLNYLKSKAAVLGYVNISGSNSLRVAPQERPGFYAPQFENMCIKLANHHDTPAIIPWWF